MRDLYLAQHLSNDNLNVLVINGHTLEAVDLLNLIHDVFGQLFHALKAQDVVSTERSIAYDFALFDLLAVEYSDRSPFRNQRFHWVTVQGCNHQAALTLGFFTERNGAGRLGENRWLLRFSRFEQVRNPR